MGNRDMATPGLTVSTRVSPEEYHALVRLARELGYVKGSGSPNVSATLAELVSQAVKSGGAHAERDRSDARA